jgi:hypothetical protein
MQTDPDSDRAGAGIVLRGRALRVQTGVMTMDAIAVTSIGVALTVCVAALVTRLGVLRKRTRPSIGNKALLDAIIAEQSPGSAGRRPTLHVQSGSGSNAGGRDKSGPELAVLEGHVRNAVLDASARQRLISDAMRAAGGDRAAALRKVLRDPHDEDRRWA